MIRMDAETGTFWGLIIGVILVLIAAAFAGYAAHPSTADERVAAQNRILHECLVLRQTEIHGLRFKCEEIKQ